MSLETLTTRKRESFFRQGIRVVAGRWQKSWSKKKKKKKKRREKDNKKLNVSDKVYAWTAWSSVDGKSFSQKEKKKRKTRKTTKIVFGNPLITIFFFTTPKKVKLKTF
jgi:hypothetical protein